MFLKKKIAYKSLVVAVGFTLISHVTFAQETSLLRTDDFVVTKSGAWCGKSANVRATSTGDAGELALTTLASEIKFIFEFECPIARRISIDIIEDGTLKRFTIEESSDWKISEASSSVNLNAKSSPAVAVSQTNKTALIPSPEFTRTETKNAGYLAKWSGECTMVFNVSAQGRPVNIRTKECSQSVFESTSTYLLRIRTIRDLSSFSTTQDYLKTFKYIKKHSDGEILPYFDPDDPEKMAFHRNKQKQAKAEVLRKNKINKDIKDDLEFRLKRYMKHFGYMIKYPQFATHENYEKMPDIPQKFTTPPYMTQSQQKVLDDLLSYSVKEAKEISKYSPVTCKTTTRTVGVLWPKKVGESTSCGKDLDVGHGVISLKKSKFKFDKTEFQEACSSELNVSFCACLTNGFNALPYSDILKVGGIEGRISEEELKLFKKSPTAFARYFALQAPSTSIAGRAGEILRTGAHVSKLTVPNAEKNQAARETAVIIGSSAGQLAATCMSNLGTR